MGINIKNNTRIVNAKLGAIDIYKYGKSFAISYGLDGASVVDNQILPVPNEIKEYLEGNKDITIYAVASNVSKLCDYALASFPKIKELYLFKNNGVVTINDNLSYLTNLRLLYVPSDYLSQYSSYTVTHSGYDSFTSVDDYVGYVVVSNRHATIVTNDNKNDLGIVAGTTIAYDRYVTNIVEDYELVIPFVGDTTLESEYLDDVLGILSNAQKLAITKLVIPTDFTEESANTIAWGYNFSSALPNLNNNIWYGTTQYNFTILTISGSGTLTSAIVDSAVDIISNDKLSVVTKVVVPTTFTFYSTYLVYKDYDLSTLPNANMYYSNSYTVSQVLDNSAIVHGLGNESPSTIQFIVGDSFKSILDNCTNGNNDVTDENNNVFVEFPTFYRESSVITDNQLTTMVVSSLALFSVYSCFVKPNGTDIMSYVRIGKYCMSSTTQANSVNATKVSMTIGSGRTLARARGTGYQLYDWQMQRLFQDLVVAYKKTVNVNQDSLLGIEHLAGGIWIDGIARKNAQWLCAYDPSKYVDSPTWTSNTNHTDGYSQVGYSAPTTTNQEIKKLGYDSNHPFFNYPSEVIINSNYDTYYYDGYFYQSGNYPVRSDVSSSNANAGLFACRTRDVWSYSDGVRLCYRPIE